MNERLDHVCQRAGRHFWGVRNSLQDSSRPAQAHILSWSSSFTAASPYGQVSAALGYHTVNHEEIWNNLSLGGKGHLQVLIWPLFAAFGGMMFNTGRSLRQSETGQARWPLVCVLISNTQYSNIPSILPHTWVLPGCKGSFWWVLIRSLALGAEISPPPPLYTTVPHLHKLSLFNYLSRCPNCATNDLWMN